MSAVTEGTTQKEMFEKLVRLLKNKLKKKDMDYWAEIPCSNKAPEGWEAIEIIFRPKKQKSVYPGGEKRGAKLG